MTTRELIIGLIGALGGGYSSAVFSRLYDKPRIIARCFTACSKALTDIGASKDYRERVLKRAKERMAGE